MTPIRVALVALCLTLGTAQAEAALITTDTALGTSITTVDFTQFSSDFTFTAGPVQIGSLIGDDIAWSSTNADAVIGNGFYGVSANGEWTPDRDGYTGLNTLDGSMTYTFASPVSGVGGFVNYTADLGGSNITISVLGDTGNVLETYALSLLAPIWTPSGLNEGAFRGILRPTNDIFALTIANQFVVLDDLEFTRAQDVPEPATVLLFGLGLVAVRRRLLVRRA